MSATGENARLLYDWTGRQDHRRRLGIWIFLALSLHAVGYFLFRAAYPEPTNSDPVAATIFILPSGGEDARRLGPMIAAADPGLFAADRLTTRPLPDPAVPDYHPSFENAPPPLAPLPNPVVDLLPPLPRDSGPVAINDGRPSPKPLPAPARDTEVTFADDLANRPTTARPTAAFTARPREPLAPATYLIAVAPDGSVRHVMEMDRTDSPQINAVAIPYLFRFKFSPVADSTDLAWGLATIHWGLDVRRLRLER